MNRLTTIGLITVLVVGIIVALSAVFTVRQSQQALVIQFGEVRRVIQDPGLHFKLPLIQNVRYFDKRVLNLEAPQQEIPTRDQKQVVVSAFARYRITNPLQYSQRVLTEEGFRAQLGAIINANLRRVLGQIPMSEILTEKRASLMQQIAVDVDNAAAPYGIDVIDVRMKRVDLPEANSEAVFQRMKTQRQQEAKRFRAEGDRDAQTIRAEADKQQTIIRANAQQTAQIRRGEGDAQATAIYNEAYSRDPSFFDFFRSMQALREGLPSETTTYVGPPEGDFFRFFASPYGFSGGQPATVPPAAGGQSQPSGLGAPAGAPAPAPSDGEVQGSVPAALPGMQATLPAGGGAASQISAP